jgi:hypothetical protein
LRATPAEPGASPPEALVEKWAALATSGDGRHPEAAETLARCASELKGALAARSPAPAGDAPTDKAVDDFIFAALEQSAVDPLDLSAAGRVDAVRAGLRAAYAVDFPRAVAPAAGAAPREEDA